MKTLLLGIDGMSYRMMRNLPMPYLRGLESGALAHGLLRSFPDSESGVPHTGPSWTSIYTGLMPHEHGFTYKGWIYGENYFDAIKHKTIFDMAGAGLSITMPITFPATAVPANVMCLAGFPAVPKSKALVSYEALRKYTDGFLLDIMDSERYAHDPEACDYQFNEELRFRTTRAMYYEYAPETVFVGMTFLDRLNHHNAQSSAIMRDAYAFLDGLIYEYVRAIMPDALIICGDHGFLPSAFMPTNHDDEGYYLFTAFNGTTSAVATGERNLTDVAHMFSLVRQCGYEWIGEKAIRPEYSPSEKDKALITSRLQALGYA